MRPPRSERSLQEGEGRRDREFHRHQLALRGAGESGDPSPHDRPRAGRAGDPDRDLPERQLSWKKRRRPADAPTSSPRSTAQNMRNSDREPTMLDILENAALKAGKAILEVYNAGPNVSFK